MNISFTDYFGPWLGCSEMTDDAEDNANELLATVNDILEIAESCGVDLPTNHKTGTLVSGEKFGGFRPQSCKEGAPKSAHKIGAAVDVFDPDNKLDEWLNDDILTTFDLYREHPDSTPGWCHLTTRAPKSKRRTFYP